MNYARYERLGYSEEDVDKILNDSNIFDDYEDCKNHGNSECNVCITEGLKFMRTANLPILLSEASQYKTVDKNEVKENFDSQVGFIQKGLGLTDKQINDLKVKEIPAKMKLAQDQITVGKMKELMEERLKPWGLIGTIIKYLTFKMENPTVRRR